MKKVWIILAVVLGVLLMAGSWFIGGLNRVVVMDENVNQAWAQVENQLQRRADLIPNLVSTVKGYMTHERELLTKVTELRSQWGKATTRAEKVEAANGMGNVLSRLLLVSENYPQLQANQNFLTLQAQLEGTENRIAVERRRYNQAVQIVNSYTRTVFGSFFASMRGIKPRIYFKAEETAKAVPKVEF